MKVRTQGPEGDNQIDPKSTNGWPISQKEEADKNYQFSDDQFSSLKSMSAQSREILASLSDLLNKRVTDIGKVVYRL